MELPQSLQSLYRHWDKHLLNGEIIESPIQHFSDPALYKNVEQFIQERMSIWKRKQIGLLPYTTDATISRYRFCNIFREFDKQTIAFHTLLNPLRDNFPLWLLNMFMCRMIARPETIETIGLLSLDAQSNTDWLNRLSAIPSPRYGNAYVFPISTIQRSATPTRETFLARHLPKNILIIAKHIEQHSHQSVFDSVQSILPLFGFNHAFLWTEALIDVAYQFPERIDLFTRFPIGPGSAPTMRRIDHKIDPTMLVTKLAQGFIDLDLTIDGKPLRLSAENWEGIGCEFRKYTNLSSGHGRKRLYTPS
jgi:hypothetical protein